MISERRLIVDDRDHAGGAGAKRVLSGGIRVAIDDSDVQGRLVLTLNLIESAGVAVDDHPHGAVRRDAGMPRALQHVTGQTAGPLGGRPPPLVEPPVPEEFVPPVALSALLARSTGCLVDQRSSGEH